MILKLTKAAADFFSASRPPGGLDSAAMADIFCAVSIITHVQQIFTNFTMATELRINDCKA
jgi:hypothetical protein